MSKTVNVKVARTTLIAALNKALDEKIKEAKEAEKATKDYQKQVEEFKKSIPALIKSGKVKIKSVSTHFWQGAPAISADLDYKGAFPKEPQTNHCGWKNEEAQKTLSNAIRVLELSNEEYVRTSSYGAVAQYL